MQTIRLYCLPFAGGSYYAYRDLQQYVSPLIQVHGIDLPGHGKRLKDALLNDLNAMALDLANQINPHPEMTYAIYGHSMGATLAYLVVRHIAQNDLPLPQHIFLSGREAPMVPIREKGVYLFPKDLFRKRLIEYGGIPEEILKEEDLMDFFEPIIRADFQALSTYVFDAEEAIALNSPFTLLHGMKDTVTTYEGACKWQELTTHTPMAIHPFEGGHFFIFDHLQKIGEIISSTLDAVKYA